VLLHNGRYSITETIEQLAKTTGKKCMRSPSPCPQLSSHESITQTPSRHEVSFKHTDKRAKVTKGAGSRNVSVSQGSTSKSHREDKSPTAQRISQALKAQRYPTNKEIRPFCKYSVNLVIKFDTHISSAVDISVFNVLAYPVERWTWDDLINKSIQQSSSVNQKLEKVFYLEKVPLSTTLQLDLSPSNVKKGGFKIAAFGTSTTRLFKSGTGMDVCAKQTYHVVERVTEMNGSLVTKSMNVPHDSRKQFQGLAMEVACVVWAQALLNIVYEFVAKETENLGQPPFQVPKFRFVEMALAMERALDDGRQKNAVFLVEEVIAEDQEGQFRKYLNNVSPIPLPMTSHEDNNRGKFLAFTQHVQYWKTRKQVFVSDYQGKPTKVPAMACVASHIILFLTGGKSVLSDPQISSARYDLSTESLY
jgi:hypothetical protein